MPGVTKQTLAFGIFSMAFDRCRLTDQLNNNAAAAEDAEELGDTIPNMSRSLAELRRLYAAYQDEIGEYESYEVLCDNAEKGYVEFSRQIIGRASRRAAELIRWCLPSQFSRGCYSHAVKRRNSLARSA